MSDFFLGEIRLFGFGFAPKNWALCNGQLLAIAQNQALFSLLGTQYGGNGVQTFALPDLRSRVPVGYGPSVDGSWNPPSMQIGESGGTESVTLLTPNLPPHTHLMKVAASATTGTPGSSVILASNSQSKTYRSGSAGSAPLAAAAVSPTGGTLPHPNLQPYQTINFAIALTGIFPSRN